MAIFNSTVPSFQVDPAIPRAFPKLELRRGSPELNALDRCYPGVSFNSVSILCASVYEMTHRPASDHCDLLEVQVSARGPWSALIEHRFAHPSWADLPQGGYRRHRTAGFGHGDVYLLKGGNYAVRPAWLDHALDLIAPVLVPTYCSAIAAGDGRARHV